MNIKEAIEKLNSFNIQDVKNIDIHKVRDVLKQSPIIVFNLALIGGTIFLTLTLFNKSKYDDKKFSRLSIEYEKKLAAVKDQDNIKKVYDEFINSFPKPINGNQLIDKFSELASERNIQILSFSPAKESGDSYTSLTTVNLSIESNDYKNIILFVKDIEDLPFAVKLEHFTAKLSEPNNFTNSSSNKDDLIRADIEVSSLKIK
jgi:Tfp pilus assembly protein PilO